MTVTGPMPPEPTAGDVAPPRPTLGDYLSLVRFSHTVFALPFATLAAVMAWQVAPFRLMHAVGFVVCMVAARTAAMAFNRLVDADIDAANERTATREIPSGRMTRRQVGGLIAISCVAFFAGTACFLPNPWPLAVGPAVLAWLLGYSLAKRFTPLCHYWLGIALGLSPIAVWIGITATLSPSVLWLGAAIALWVGGFDILYACQDETFDRDAGLKSIPAWLGTTGAFWVARVSHLLTVAVLAMFAVSADFGTIFFGGLGLIAAALLVEHVLISPRDLKRVGLAFFQMNTLVSFGVLLFGTLDTLL